MKKILFIVFFVVAAYITFPSSNDIAYWESELANSSGDDKILALNDLALAYSEDHYEKATTCANQALSLSLAAKSKPLEARTRLNLGNVYYEHCEYESALNEFRKSLSIYKENNSTNFIDINYALNNIAIVYEAIGEYTNALACYLESLRIADKIKNREGIATAYVNLGSFYDTLGMYNKAIEYLTNALHLFKLENCNDGIATTLGDLSSTYLNLTNYNIIKLYKIYMHINFKAILSLFVIFAIVGLLLFTPKGKEMTGNYTKPMGSFVKTITGKVTNVKKPAESKKLDIFLTGINPSSLDNIEISINGNKFEGKLNYEAMSLLNSGLKFDDREINVRIDGLLGDIHSSEMEI